MPETKAGYQGVGFSNNGFAQILKLATSHKSFANGVAGWGDLCYSAIERNKGAKMPETTSLIAFALRMVLSPARTWSI
ncbi:hypothetical protein AGR4A_pAt30064 [Agrobacterium tumefaciens str. B6]|uniref:Uncharacterized protein n=1 Tax=Agrobacterium tumefaciens str. B6 TaxID=1183423 RepID=A0A822VCB3_AGRTU|nr:hypothetical protein AGR4A_pAt30064 [Agrobacterium tumefaciens str. B6]